MARRFTIAIAVVAAVTLSAFGTMPAGRAQPATDSGGRIVAAAEAYLATLDADQRAKARLDLNAKTRTVWSNLPTGIAMQVGATERNGLKLGAMTPAQEKAALALVAAALSRDGYQKVMAIVDADELLEQRSAPTRAATARTRFGRAEYYLAILGTPSAADRWMLQFGGHHLAVNVTFAGRAQVLTPTHTGAQPASYTIDGRTVRPLGDEKDKAFALMNGLTPAQRKEAVLGVDVRNLVLGPGEDGRMIAPEGVKGSTLTAAQRTLLADLIGEWVGIIGDDAAAAKMTEVKVRPRRHLFCLGWRHHGRCERLLPHSGALGVHRVRAPGQSRLGRSHPHHLSGPDQRLRRAGDGAMTRIAAVTSALVLATSIGADAHRLDEYLQAARVSVASTGIVVHLDLTPGVSLASDVIATLDRDGDGRTSPLEAEAYGRVVLGDVSARLDGAPLGLSAATGGSADGWRDARRCWHHPHRSRRRPCGAARTAPVRVAESASI